MRVWPDLPWKRLFLRMVFRLFGIPQHCPPNLSFPKWVAGQEVPSADFMSFIGCFRKPFRLRLSCHKFASASMAEGRKVRCSERSRWASLGYRVGRHRTHPPVYVNPRLSEPLGAACWQQLSTSTVRSPCLIHAHKLELLSERNPFREAFRMLPRVRRGAHVQEVFYSSPYCFNFRPKSNAAHVSRSVLGSGYPHTLKLQMEDANLSSTTDESRVQLMSLG